MSMTLGYMRRHLREALKEQDPDDSLWTDLTLNDFLNEGAKVMASRCQPQETAFQFTVSLVSGSTTEYQRERKLPSDVDEVFGVYVKNGVQQQLTRRSFNRSMRNADTGTPTGFYVRRSKKRIETNATDITVSDIDLVKRRPKLMLGLDPKPDDDYVITVFYYSLDSFMRNDADTPTIPFEFCRGIIDYAAYLAYRSDEMYATANLYLETFSAYVAGCQAKVMNEGQETEFPVMKIRDDDIADLYELGRAVD